MGFVVYVDDPLDYARIHKEDCSFYQNRKGEDMETAYWKGGFETKEEALDYARQTDKSDIKICGVCLKSTSRSIPESMSSKYDSFWREFFQDKGGIEQVLQKADLEEKVEYEVDEIKNYGNRQSWSGKVVLSEEGVIDRGEMAHMRALKNNVPDKIHSGSKYSFKISQKGNKLRFIVEPLQEKQEVIEEKNNVEDDDIQKDITPKIQIRTAGEERLKEIFPSLIERSKFPYKDDPNHCSICGKKLSKFDKFVEDEVSKRDHRICSVCRQKLIFGG